MKQDLSANTESGSLEMSSVLLGSIPVAILEPDSGRMTGELLEADQQTRSSSFCLLDDPVREKGHVSGALKKS